MQQVHGCSRLQTVPSELATAARRMLWIRSSWRDLVLYVVIPLLLVPAFALAQSMPIPQDISLLRSPVSARNLCRFLLVGPEGNFVNRFLLGCLARIDADLRVLPHLRRQNGNLRHAYPPARFGHVPDLVCHCGSAFAIPAKRYAGHLLHVWRAVYPAIRCKPRPKHVSRRRHFCVGFVRRAFRPDLDRGASAKSGKTWTAGDQHRVLVVLQ